MYTTYIHTTPDRLWAALTTPALTRRYVDLVEGFMAVDSTWEPGAPIAYRTDDGQAQIEGHILAVEAPAHLSTQLSLRYDPDVRRDRPSRLTWDIVPMGEVCRLTVVHDEVDGETASARDIAACMPAILGNLKLVLETGRPRLIKEIVFDCASPETLAVFWAAATGYVRQAQNDDFIALADPLAIGPELAFARVPEAKTVKNRVHFDLHVADVPAEAARLVALGASEVPGYPQSEERMVLSDPEGNEFCLGA